MVKHGIPTQIVLLCCTPSIKSGIDKLQPIGQTSLPIFINEALLELNCIHSVTYSLCLSSSSSRVDQLQQRSYDSQSFKYLLSGPLQKKFAVSRNIKETNFLKSRKEELPDEVYQQSLESILSCAAVLTSNLINICAGHRNRSLVIRRRQTYG